MVTHRDCSNFRLLKDDGMVPFRPLPLKDLKFDTYNQCTGKKTDEKVILMSTVINSLLNARGGPGQALSVPERSDIDRSTVYSTKQNFES